MFRLNTLYDSSINLSAEIQLTVAREEEEQRKKVQRDTRVLRCIQLHSFSVPYRDHATEDWLWLLQTARLKQPTSSCLTDGTDQVSN